MPPADDADQVDQPHRHVASLMSRLDQDVGCLEIAVRNLPAVHVANDPRQTLDKHSQSATLVLPGQRTQPKQERAKLESVFNLLDQQETVPANAATQSVQDRQRARGGQTAVKKGMSCLPGSQGRRRAKQIRQGVFPRAAANVLVNE